MANHKSATYHNEVEPLINTKDVYCEHVLGQRIPKIGCSYIAWQDIVITGLIAHYKMIETVNDEMKDIVNVLYLYTFTERQLNRFDIYYESVTPERDAGYFHEKGFIGLETSILEYLNRLCEKGYLVDRLVLDECEDVCRFRLSERFKREFL